MTWTEHTVVREGVRIACPDWGGSGPPVVLLHGLAGHAGAWDCLARDLSPRHRVVAVDQRGHGASERRPQLVLVEAGPGRADPNVQTEIGAMLDAWL
ncbi:alpha/beta fold hydrolase [Streptomyces iakyrus]|uniref:alpha/beta fold hydrolase n=1 Tax=Streptomyces iakyrus TaxID=68219 RepID=UPI0033D4101A